jgi:hypothetical protein
MTGLKGGVRMRDNRLGSWSFLIGLILAVVLGLGLTSYQKELTWILFLMGVVVGLVNVTAHETQSFLTAGTILALLSFLGIQVGVFDGAEAIANILRGILTLFIPATIVVALKAVYELAHE